MSIRLFLLTVLFACRISYAQVCDLKSGEFCGAKYKRLHPLKKQLAEQLRFLNVQQGDTVVDIGAASGWYEGALSATTHLSSVHFVLVDLDSACLNAQRVNNMLAHYSKLKGEPIRNSFQLVLNTPDSLFLPTNRYRKAWLLNVLHEVPSINDLLSQVSGVLQTGGEVVILEMEPKTPGALHGGCNKPLLPPDEWKRLFAVAGFRFVDNLRYERNKRQTIQLMRFAKL